MDKNKKIYLAGHTGLIGSVLMESLKQEGYTEIIVRTHQELDLLKQAEVEDFFKTQRPAYVILAAARVGGIKANSTLPAQFLYENLMIQSHVIHSAFKFGSEKLLFYGSACSYPLESPQPMKEEYLLSGPLEPTNEPYAIAKIAGMKMCEAYRRQYGANYISAVPTNVYGPGDNFDTDDSHVIPALLRRFHDAKIRKLAKVTAWGTGRPLREFIYVDDVARVSLFLMDYYNEADPINIGTEEEVTIKELTFLIKDIVGFTGEVVFDKTKPDGSARKALDLAKLRRLGWKAKTPLAEGLKKTYDWYVRTKMHLDQDNDRQ